ncbi:acyl-CoA--sterol O-acyltransferase 1-like protein [Corchorus capsularis]|uniref:Acyl-CoA--sterol O-acyltransferase 1-like protein n=1 Tax=Corchorus capsularis TaxID=210143 RepID=A0A1R3IM59_COCAP|nr:acyl-CoA--sterol O-acyltransferase 1-like protein [Corchorus capsularis]
MEMKFKRLEGGGDERGPWPKEKRRSLKLASQARKKEVGPQKWKEERFKGRITKRKMIGSLKNTNPSLMNFSSKPCLTSGAKKSQNPVTTTNPTVNGTEMAGGNRRELVRTAFFTTISIATQKPCNEKNNVNSHVGYTCVQ